MNAAFCSLITRTRASHRDFLCGEGERFRVDPECLDLPTLTNGQTIHSLRKRCPSRADPGGCQNKKERHITIISEDIRHSPFTVVVVAKSIPSTLIMTCFLSSCSAPSISLYHILSIFVHDHGYLTNGTTNPTSLHRILFSAPHFCLLAHFLFSFHLSVWLSLGIKRGSSLFSSPSS